ncbi:major capsid protein P2 [Photobacterium sp. R1]
MSVVAVTPEAQAQAIANYKYQGVKKLKLSSFSGVTYNGRSTLTVPTGQTFDAFMFNTNLPLERLEITFRLNSNAFISGIPATFFQTLEQYKQMDVPAALAPQGEQVFIVSFADLSLKLKDGQQLTSLVTMLGESLQIQVDIGAKQDGDPEMPTLEVIAEVNTPQAVRMYLPRIERLQIDMPAQGTNTFNTLPNDMKRSIRRMHFMTDAIEELEIKRDDNVAYETTAWRECYMANRNDLMWQQGMFHLDFLMRGFIRNEMFPTARAKELLFTFKTSKPAGSVTVITEYLDVERTAAQVAG